MPALLGNAKRKVGAFIGPPIFEEAALIYSLFKNRKDGVLVEVGAHTGDDVFMRFAADGWEVHAFEPDPGNREPLERATAQLSNVTVVPKAVADKPGTMTLYTSDESTGISSLAPFTEGHSAALEVDVTTLSDYLQSGGPDHVDFLKVDVEGYEKFVMAGYPWDTHKPDAVLLEFENAKTEPLGYTWRDLAEELTGHGYGVLVFEWHPIVRYGVVHRWRRFARYPTELADDDAWGNLLAVASDIDRVERAARLMAFRFRLRSAIGRARRRNG
jgi:FkbM family methyltransferase